MRKIRLERLLELEETKERGKINVFKWNSMVMLYFNCDKNIVEEGASEE
jgi:hypothetical protein